MASSWFYDPAFSGIEDLYLADVDINPGNSGGPVYSIDNAKVIGVTVSTQQLPVDVRGAQNEQVPNLRLLYSSGIAQVIPAKYIIALLEKHGLKWQQ